MSRKICGFLVAGMLFSQSVLAAPSIEWSEQLIDVQVGHGRSTEVTVFIESSSSIEGLELAVVPKLAPFVSVTQRELTSSQIVGLRSHFTS